MSTLFALLPAGTPLPGELATPPPRRYPKADDGAHLLSLVRAGRDRAATRWLPGAVKAVLVGAIIGAITNGVLAGAFAMFGGLVGLAIALGAGVGAFLGGFTAAMTGTEVARDEVRRLAVAVQPGDTLLQWDGVREHLVALRAHCERLGFANSLAD